MKKILYLILGLLLWPTLAMASTVQINVDTSNLSVNALEATIQIPRTVSVSKIIDGNSTIIFWIKPPELDIQTNTIYFAGLTPGGFAGKQPVLSIVGDFKPDDLKNILFKAVTAYKNDGKGTEARVRLYVSEANDVVDTVPPEPFTPIISRSENIFNGRSFVSFATQDKGSGIDHYEFKPSFVLFGSPDEGGWIVVESPLELQPMNLFQKIFIRAIDKFGNKITQSTVGPYYYYLWSLIWVIIISLTLWVLSYIRKRLG